MKSKLLDVWVIIFSRLISFIGKIQAAYGVIVIKKEYEVFINDKVP